MIKYKLLFIFIVSTLFAFSQKINTSEITYKVKVYKKERDKKSNKRAQQIISEIPNIEMELIFSNDSAVFRTPKIMNINSKTKFLRRMARTVVGLNSDFIYDLKNHNMNRLTELDGVKYSISSNLDTYSWKLINESKLIGGKKCYKAITKKNVTDRNGNETVLNVIAWYYPDINIPLGPKDYSGLPGLILELNEGIDRITYYVDKIKRDSSNKRLNVNLDNRVKITSEKYDLLVKESYKSWKN